MKQEKLNQFILEHFDLKPPDARIVGGVQQRKRMRDHLERLKSQPDWEEDDEIRTLVEEIEHSLDPKQNSTLPLELTLKDQHRLCSDCGRVATNRVVHSRILMSPAQHWRHSCGYCKQTLNPETGKFDLNNRSVHYFFVSYFKKENK
jgi:hypothetical protein